MNMKNFDNVGGDYHSVSCHDWSGRLPVFDTKKQRRISAHTEEDRNAKAFILLSLVPYVSLKLVEVWYS